MIIGGADPAIPNVNCTDVEIRDNLFYKPPSWKGVYLVANNWETKSSSRVWLQGNVFDGSWPDAQIGFVWNWKTANQSGGCNWCQSSHLTAVYNVLQNGAMGMQLTGCETYGRVGATCVNTNHVRVSRNVFRQISTPGAAGFSSSARNMMIGQVGAAAISDNVFDKATPTTGTFYHAFMFSTTVVGPLRIVGNAVDSATYFTKDVTTMAPGAVVVRNASPKSGMVSGNVQTKTLAEAETRAAVGVRAAVDSATRRARTGLPR